ERGHVAKVSAEPKRFVREVRLDKAAEHEAGEALKPEQFKEIFEGSQPFKGALLGAVLTVEAFKDIPRVDVIGTMKGRGFTGVMKRHGFSGLEKTHGVLRKHRAAGSIGSNTSPGRVRKGTRMNGQHGNCRRTVRNMKVVRIDVDNNTLLVEGG